MKLVIIALLTAFSLPAFSNSIELGKYIARDKKTQKDKVADLVLLENGKAEIRIRADGVRVTCKGTWTVEEKLFKAHAKCNSIFLPETDVEIDITNVNSESIRQAPGAVVSVMLDVFEQPEDFYLMKND